MGWDYILEGSDGGVIDYFYVVEGEFIIKPSKTVPSATCVSIVLMLH